MTEGFFKWLARNAKETVRGFLYEVIVNRETRGVTEFIVGCVCCVLTPLVHLAVFVLTSNAIVPVLASVFWFASWLLVALHGAYLWGAWGQKGEKHEEEV
jgi:hypothetical protein